MRRVVRSELELNKPLKWPLYDKAGNLLLQAGFVLSMPHYIDALLERGACVAIGDGTEIKPTARPMSNAPVYSSSSPRDPAFTRTDNVCMAIKRVHKQVSEPPGQVALSDYVRMQARALIEAVEEDPDSVLASGHINRQIRDYRVNHQFLGSVICALMAPLLGITGGERESLVCAALTRDVGILHIDAVIATSASGELSEPLRRSVSAHTRASVTLLQERGVSDPVWLGFVLDHHERMDGSGYPSGKQPEQISVGARLIGLADSYASMVLPSERRKGNFAANVVRQLFLERRLYDEQQVALLFKTLTKYPPSSLVSLANGEIAVVKVRSFGDAPPAVHSVYDRNGMPRMQPILRDTSDPAFAITGVVEPEQCRSAELIIKRLWLKP